MVAPAHLDAQAAILDSAPASSLRHTETVAHEVAAAIAERWSVAATTVVVELISDGQWPEAGTAFRLTGSGAEGRWAVWFDEANGARQLLVRAGVQQSVATAARDLDRGTELTASDLVMEPGVHWGSVTRAESVVPGWVTRRRIARGETIHRPAAEPRHVVKAGDDVRIEVVYGAISLSVSGRAAGSAAIGETVVVRAQTGKRLEGVVVAPGLVRIGTLQEAR
jgi:flagella basal body P-ring formation protein FlgA